MNKEKYIKLFYILFVITTIVSAFVSFIIGTGLKTLLLFYELFYIITVYKGKYRNYISLYLFLLIVLFLFDAFVLKEPGLLINILNLVITPVFIFSFYSENKLCKFKVLELLKLLAIALPILYLFKNDYSLVMPMIALYPFLFLDREFNLKSSVAAVIVALIFSQSNDFMLVLPMLVINVIMLIYNAIKKRKGYAILSIILIAISIFGTLYPTPIFIYRFDSDVFFNERLLIKLSKIFVAIIPFAIYTLITLKSLKDNKTKINHEIFLAGISYLVFVFVNAYTRFDYEVLLVLIGSLSLFLMYEYSKVSLKKVDDKKITIMVPNLSLNDSLFNALALNKLFDKNKIEIISSYKNEKEYVSLDNVTYLVKKKDNQVNLKKALNEKNVIGIIKEGLIRVINLINVKSYSKEMLMELDSKYVITNNYVENEYASYYTSNDVVKIAIEHNLNKEDETYIGKVVKSVTNSDYLVVTTEEAEKIYKEKLEKTKCVYIPNALYKSPKKGAKHGSHNIISIGDLTIDNGFEDLLDVTKTIKSKYDDVKLTVVGVGEEKKILDEKVKENKLSKNVYLVGNLKEEVLEEVLLDSSVYVGTSMLLTSDINMVLAQNYLLPVVAFDNENEVKYLLKKSAVLLEKRDNKNLAQEIIEILDNKKNFDKYSKLSKENAKDYSLSSVKALWEKIIK